jgi:SpoU rRNA methylase family enzyme
MLNCKQVSVLVSKSKEQKLNFWERMNLRIHIWICGPCTEFEKNSVHLSEVMREYRKQERKLEKD